MVIADERGQVVGFGQAGPGNHESVGYDGLSRALRTAFDRACPDGLSIDQVAGGGFGVGGYDFPDEAEDTLKAISALGIRGPVQAVNDTIIGLVAGSPDGWGVAVISGTGCNCWGWDQSRQRIGRVTGHGAYMGEGAGASELVEKSVQAIAHQWTQRGPATLLTPAYLRHTGAKDLEDLIEGLILERYSLDASAAPLIFAVAAAGDPAAQALIRWAGCELGELVNAVTRQLEFQRLAFNVVMLGSMFDGGEMLVAPMRETIHAFAPGARLLRLTDPPVIGAVLLGMEAAGVCYEQGTRRRLSETLASLASSR